MTDSTSTPAAVPSGTPAFDGKCAFALSMGPADKAPQGKPEYALERDGQTYLFMGAVPRFLFTVIPGSAKRAQEHWAKRA